ncbi:MAG: alpha/beta fold hydrolase [bacterium]
MPLRALSLVLLIGAAAHAQSPALIADSGRTTRGSLGGEARTFRIASSILGETRRINVAFPRSWLVTASERRYPVAIILDGEADLPAAAAVSEELSQQGQIPEMVIVAIENTNRLRDLTPPGLSVSGSSTHEGGDRFLDFIEKELLPAVDRQFRGSKPRVFVGHSSGGILATYVAATRTTFRAVIALDTPIHLGENWLAKKLTAAAEKSETPLRYASYEARFSWPDAQWTSLVAAARPTWKLHHERLNMESHESMFMLGAYLGLRQVFSDYSMLAAPVAPTTSILPYYKKVGESLGADVIPPRHLLENVAEDLLMEGRGKAAHEAYTIMEAGYGKPANSVALLARIADVERRPPPSETVEGLMATPFPTPDEAKSYLGEWIGDVWMNSDELYAGRPRHHLRLRVVGGRVEGEVENEPAPGEKMIEKITYLKVTPVGLSFGYMNGMRPRGVLVHDGILKNGTLSGVMRFGGVDFKYPDGMTPPAIKFSFRKVP